MKRMNVIVVISFLVFFIINPHICLAENTNVTLPQVVCTTSPLAHMTKEIGQKLISVTTIAPAGMCPAHFDIKPSQIKAVREAKLLISHNFEPWIENLITSADNTNIERLVLVGPWNTPVSAIGKINEITEMLGRQFPGNEHQFRLNAQKLIQDINQNGIAIKARAEQLGVNQFKVITSFHQASFVEWLGFKVIADYPAPEMISTRQFLELLLIGKREKADLIVDNLQSGTDFGTR